VGGSTKAGDAKTIGKKGVGFKSVFKVLVVVLIFIF